MGDAPSRCDIAGYYGVIAIGYVEGSSVLWILWVLQRISRFRRRIFGKTTPHWLKDGLSILEFVNVLDLMPTLLATTLSPHHFYKRVPQIVANKRTWYKTPIKFLSSGVALIVLLLLFLDFEVLEKFGLTDKTLLARYLFVICLTAPLTIPLVALIFRIGLAVISAMPGSYAGSGPALPNLIVPLSPWTYTRLDYKHFFWSIFYFGIYFYIALQIYQLLGFYIFEYGGEFANVLLRKADYCLSYVDELDRLSNHAITADEKAKHLAQCRSWGTHSETSTGLLAGSLFAFIGLVVILLGYAILINPYIWLLRAAVKIPTKRMHKSDCSPAAALIDSIAASKKEKSIKNQVAALDRSITQLEKEVRAQNLKAASAGPKYVEKLHIERGTVYKRMLNVASLRTVADNSSFQSELREHIVILADRIDKLFAPTEAEKRSVSHHVGRVTGAGSVELADARTSAPLP